MRKNSYKDIGIYTAAILAVMLLYQMKVINYTVMSALLMLALAIFVVYNFRNSIMKLISKKQNR